MKSRVSRVPNDPLAKIGGGQTQAFACRLQERRRPLPAGRQRSMPFMAREVARTLNQKNLNQVRPPFDYPLSMG
ncbi:hypothetical protein [Rhodovulum sp. P5]|uniref:hypothetical protein n=1 Tax=Rhodovulum sp. P5 TaxID=1564506 RepID=UPI0012EBF5F4|nr:hypothetical protein [Rhodovulum sp. P5]